MSVDLDSPATLRPARSWHQQMTVALFAVLGFLAAALLFVLEPLSAKSLLPVLGGSPSVWNTAMAFFQVALLVGYLAAHLIDTHLPPRSQRLIQLALIGAPLITLPFALPGGYDSSTSPLWWELVALTTMVGAPFLGLATVSPTVQIWFSRTNHPRATDPFFLYAASNLGSFTGLLAYPIVIEPHLDLVEQTTSFAAFYLLFVALLIATSLIKQRPPTSQLGSGAETVSMRDRLYWVAAAAIASLMLLAVTRHIATDVASFPLLWVVPLALYLGTFVLSFSRLSAPLARFAVRALPLVAVAVVVASIGVSTSVWVGVALPLALLVLTGVVAHGTIYARRPHHSRLTEFYIWISTGGAVGGLLGALVAPLVFSDVLEYPIAVVAAISLCGVVSRLGTLHRRTAYAVFASAVIGLAFDFGFKGTVLLLSVAAVAAIAAARRAVVLASLVAILFAASALNTEDELLVERRTFFGVSRVLSDGSNHTLVSGTTVHGAQRFYPNPSLKPLAYYFPEGPFGQTMAEFGTDARTVGVIGLGAGVMASFGQAGQTIYFYEIDPAVVEIASNTTLFTFLDESAAEVEIAVGDGRLTIDDPHPPFDLLIVDAFSSDSIPTHLLTKQAISMYFDQLQEGSVVGLHISNRHLDLEPVIGRLASELGLHARINHYTPPPEAIDAAPTTFVVLGRQLHDLGNLASNPAWQDLRVGTQLWTDTYTDLMSVIRWR